MRYWRAIAGICLLWGLTACTEALNEDAPALSQEVAVTFSARQQAPSGLTVEVGTRFSTTPDTVGIVGFTLQEEDSLRDFLFGAGESSIYTRLKNAPFTGSFPGALSPCDTLLTPYFPIEEGSAITLYAYYPYRPSYTLDYSTCYIPIDLEADHAQADYCYTGKVYRSKAQYIREGTFDLSFKHACARYMLMIATPDSVLEQEQRLTLDSVLIGLDRSGKCMLNLKDGSINAQEAQAGELYSITIPCPTLTIKGYADTLRTRFFLPPQIEATRIVLYGKRGGNAFVKSQTVSPQLYLEQGVIAGGSYTIKCVYKP